jgi:hypothetical protein
MICNAKCTEIFIPPWLLLLLTPLFSSVCLIFHILLLFNVYMNISYCCTLICFNGVSSFSISQQKWSTFTLKLGTEFVEINKKIYQSFFLYKFFKYKRTVWGDCGHKYSTYSQCKALDMGCISHLPQNPASKAFWNKISLSSKIKNSNYFLFIISDL